MKIFKMKRDGYYGIGFIDPNIVHERTIEWNQKDTDMIVLKYLKELHTNAHILLPYNFK